MSSPTLNRRRSAQDAELEPSERLTRQYSPSESEDQSLLSDSNAGASSVSGPNIIVHQPEGSSPSPKPSPETPYVSNRPQTSADSRPRGRESFGFEELSVDNAEPSNGFVLPSTIQYSLDICFIDKFRGRAAVNQDLPYNDPKSYQGIEEKATSYIRENYHEVLGTKEPCFRIGKCSIVSENGYKDTHALTSREDWKTICKILISLLNTKNLGTLGLEISRDYFALQTEVISGEPCAKTIRNEIQVLMKSSDCGRYIPRTELSRITSSNTLRQVIYEDASLTVEPDEKEIFIQRVQSNATRLLLMCVDKKLQMRCLKQLLDKGLSDADLPLKDDHLCHPGCWDEFESLIAVQGKFMAAEFLKIGEHQNFSDQVVLPIHYKEVKTQDNSPAEDNSEHYRTDEKNANAPKSKSPHGENSDGSAKDKAWCGSGAYSNVYRVNIDPDHHRLTKDRDSDYAVKEFKDRPQRGSSDFNRELRVLDELLHYPDKHVVTHLATWTQRERYYMLFPYAECNLLEYMKKVAFGERDNQNILWLLKQLRGLAKAVRTIHNLSTIETSKSRPNLAPSSAQEKKSGWHHDLKPANILFFGRLIFESMGSKRGTFRIADFGAGKIHTYRSGSVNTKSPNGTLTYEPPEIMEGATSRPYDLWSLGCVFLELLIWAIFDFSAVKDFASQRFGRRYPGSMTNNLEDDAFWQMAEDRRVSLREAVIKWVKLLGEKILQPEWQHFNAFEEVLDLVSRMLETDRLRRISALDLWDTLDRIYRQTKLDLNRTNGNQERGSSPSPLPRLSLKAPDRRSPERPLITSTSPLNTQVISPANRQVDSISGDALTASPADSPDMSRGTNSRNSFANRP